MKWVLVILMLLTLPLLSGEQSSDELIQQANDAYAAGEHAHTLAERQANFNVAFNDYLNLEERDHPRYGNGQLYLALANSAYQLDAYPWAVLYGERALQLRPHDPIIQENLDKALHKLVLPLPQPASVWQPFFLWHWGISLPMRLQGIFGLSIALLALLSLYIWWEKAGLLRVALWIAAVWLLMLGSVAYTRYVEPLEAVLVRASLLYRDASLQYPPVQGEPLLPGSKLNVLKVSEEGQWLKVLTLSGSVGYLPAETVHLL